MPFIPNQGGVLFQQSLVRDRGYTHPHTNLERSISHCTCFCLKKTHTVTGRTCKLHRDKLEMSVITLCPAGVAPSAVMCGFSCLTLGWSISVHCGIPDKLFQMCGQIHTSKSTTTLIPKPKNSKEVTSQDIFLYMPLYFFISFHSSLISFFINLLHSLLYFQHSSVVFFLSSSKDESVIKL